MKKIDALLKRVEYFERLAVYGDRSTFLKRLAQAEPNSSQLIGPPDPLKSEDPNAPAPDGVMNMPEDHITGLRPIDPKVQNMLNDILVPTGDIFMLRPDGRIGKNTQNALNKFKEKFGPATVANITKVHSEKSNPASAVAKKDPGAPLPAGVSKLPSIGNTKADPAGGRAGNETKVNGPKA